MKRAIALILAMLLAASQTFAATIYFNSYRTYGSGVGGGGGSATVTWLAPRLNASQGALGYTPTYEVRWGTTQGGPYTQTSGDLAPPASSATWMLSETTYSYAISSLASGTWYFVVYVKDGSGNTSHASIEQLKVIP